MKRITLALLVAVLALGLGSCCLFEGGNVEQAAVLKLEDHLQKLQADHMSRLTKEEDKDDIGKAWEATFHVVEALKRQAGD